MPDPTETPRPAASAAIAGAQSAIVTNVAIISTWILALCLSYLPVEVPANVAGAVDMLVVTGVAFTVSYFASRARSAEWTATGDVSGIKKLLMLPLAVGLLSASTLGCSQSPEQQEFAALKVTSLAQRFAHAELDRRCSDAKIKASREVATQCILLADENVAAQASILAGARAYQAAVAGGEATQVESAIQATQWAVCAVMALFPNPETPTVGLPSDCAGASR